MEEVEVKILGVDRKEIEKKLISLGAKKVFDGEVNDLIFDFQDASIIKAGNLLRLREIGSKSTLTFKKTLDEKDAKKCEELEVEIFDFDKMKLIFEYLDLGVCGCLKKYRTSYMLDGVHFEFDKYKGEYNLIPEFLEIEAKDVEIIYKFVELFGLRREDCRAWTTFDVIDYYKKQQKSKNDF